MVLDLYQVKTHHSNMNEDEQSNDCLEILFKPYDLIKDKSLINKKNYDLVNTITVEVDESNPIDTLEKMFYRFNSGKGYSHRSMTTSDVIAIHSKLEDTLYCYCDFCGWVKLNKF